MSMLPLPPPLLIIVLAVLVYLHLIASTSTAAGSSATHHAKNTIPRYPDFQHFKVKQTIAEIKTNKPTKKPQHPENTHEKKGKLKVMHRDNMITPLQTNFHDRFLELMKRDARRVTGLVHRLSNVSTGRPYQVQEDFGSEVVSGMDHGTWEYVIQIGVGSPPTTQYMVIDIGSDVVWVQCQPCDQCYPQSDPVFNPENSGSFSRISCSSSVCDRLDSGGCHKGQCMYEVSYADGSYTKGALVLETLTLGRTTIKNVAIGCGHKNRGMFVGASGLMGLGGGSMSFLGQLGGQAGGAFTYCLASRGNDSPGWMEFGRGAFPMGVAWVPLLRNPQAPSFYYVGLSGLGVGGTQVPISEDVFRLTELGDGGVVMDTGTPVSRLPTLAYEAFRDAYTALTGNLPRVSPVSIFDTCYDLSGFVTVRVPTVSFYFSGGLILTLPAQNFLVPVNDAGTFCFAFAPSPSALSILGNIQQSGIQISIDTLGYMGFGPNVC